MSKLTRRLKKEFGVTVGGDGGKFYEGIVLTALADEKGKWNTVSRSKKPIRDDDL